jgi:hypothetical protein
MNPSTPENASPAPTPFATTGVGGPPWDALTRRQALKTITLAASGLALPSFARAKPAGSPLTLPETAWSKIVGFNYQPSYGSNGFELWQKFDARTIAVELARGKKYFPRINALRWWQSWSSFNRDPKRYARDFATTLDLAAAIGCKVMPVMFNRWHDPVLDYGGIYMDHFFPSDRYGWVRKPGMFDAFFETIVGGHAKDERILAWDLCNEPFAYIQRPAEIPEIVQAEFEWLRAMHDLCKRLGAMAPVTVGIHPDHGRAGIEQIAPICDVLCVHPYWIPKKDQPDGGKADYERRVDDYVAFALQVGKPLVCSETCWGELDDAKRVEIVRYTLTQLKQRNIGTLVYLLHHSLIADAHRPEFGHVGVPGNLAFIEADGSLRPGHEVFNEF